MDQKSGFNSLTKTFHSLRPPINLPSENTPLSVSTYALSLQLNSPSSSNSLALIDSATGQRVTYTEFTQLTKTLAFHIQSIIKLSKGDTAFILSPNSIRVPILYLALLSLGVIISPTNPVSTESEISRQIQLSKPVIAFATSATRHKVPKLSHETILIDSPEFESMMLTCPAGEGEFRGVEVSQSDVAAIMYSSGTTGKVKGVMLTHRNLIAIIAGYYSSRKERESQGVTLYTVPFFHVYGLFYSVKSVALNETVVVMERFDLSKMLKAVEMFRVTHLAAAPPVVLAMAKGVATDGYDSRSLEEVGSGGAPLGKDVIAAFTTKFPGVLLMQVS